MPQIIHRDAKTSQDKTVKNESAVVKQRDQSKSAAKREPFQPSVKMVLVAGVLTLALIAFLFRTYVMPPAPVKEVHKVAPLQGFPDVAPYNLKEWQDLYKQGKAAP